jgi:hypothetical protein
MRRRLPLVLAALVAGLAACAAVPSGRSAALPAAERACGWRTSAPSTYDHVVWIVLENHSYGDLVGSPSSPSLNRLAASCGLATNDWALTHPSLPNYLALVSGGTGGVTADCSPGGCPQHRRTIFDQVRSHGGSWRVLAEAMPSACRHSDAGRYVARHNPPTYFPATARACRRWDLPMGTTSRGRLVDLVRGGRLPTFLVVVPDQCHNTHDCPISSGDAWLSKVVPLIVGGPDYRAGRTALFITWDEGRGGYAGQSCRADRDRSCHIVTVVVSPTTSPGTRSAIGYDPYSLLETTERLLGIHTLLGHAADASTKDLRRGFGL